MKDNKQIIQEIFKGSRGTLTDLRNYDISQDKLEFELNHPRIRELKGHLDDLSDLEIIQSRKRENGISVKLEDL